MAPETPGEERSTPGDTLRRRIRRRLNGFVDRIVPPDEHRTGPGLARARLVVGFTLSLVGWAPVFAIIYGVLGLPQLSVALIGAGVLAALGPLLLRRTGSVALAAHWMVSILFGVLTIIVLSTGGHGSVAEPWYVAVPMIALVLGGPRHGLPWAVIVLVWMLALYGLTLAGVVLANPFTPGGERVRRVGGPDRARGAHRDPHGALRGRQRSRRRGARERQPGARGRA